MAVRASPAHYPYLGIRGNWDFGNVAPHSQHPAHATAIRAEQQKLAM